MSEKGNDDGAVAAGESLEMAAPTSAAVDPAPPERSNHRSGGKTFAANFMAAQGTPVQVGLQLPPDAATALVQQHPERVLALAGQVDDHAYSLASTRESNRHAERVRESEQDHAAEMAEVKDRPEERKHRIHVLGMALLALVVLLGFGAYTGSVELIGEWIEKFIILGLGAMGGAGYRALKDNSD